MNWDAKNNKDYKQDPEPNESHFLRNFIITLLCLIALLVYDERKIEDGSNVHYSNEAPDSRFIIGSSKDGSTFPMIDDDDDDYDDDDDDDDADDDNNNGSSTGSNVSNGSSQQGSSQPQGAMDKELIKMNPHVH